MRQKRRIFYLLKFKIFRCISIYNVYEKLTNTKSNRAIRLNRKLYLPSFGNLSSGGLFLFLLVEVKSMISTTKLAINSPKTSISKKNTSIIIKKYC